VTLTLTLDRDTSHGIPSCINHQPLSTNQSSFKSEKLYENGRTYKDRRKHNI